MSSCMVLDPLEAQVVRRPRHLSGRGGEYVLGESSSKILNFNCFFIYCANLILSCTQKYFHLVEGVSEEMTNIVFNKVARKVIKHTIKHAHLVCTTFYYS
jgi:hypothetical protein